LIVAAQEGREDCVQVLLEAGADIHAAPFKGKTALAAAAYYGHTRTMKLLIKHGADIHGKNRHRSMIHGPLMNGHADAVKLLIESGVDVNCRLDDNRTPLMVAANGGPTSSGDRLKTIRVLLDKQADINLTDSSGNTAFSIAANRRNASLLALLLKAGVDPDYRLKPHTPQKAGETALFDAIRGRRIAVIKVLVQAGASVHVQSDSGLTPFKCAMRRPKDKFTKQIDTLLKQSANQKRIQPTTPHNSPSPQTP
jgi:ankyrin repeat protein